MTASAVDPFVFCDRVRFADLDARGHLNNVAFLQFFEAARIAFIRHLDPEQDPRTPSDGDYILAHQSVDYRAQAGFEEEIQVAVEVLEAGPRKFRLRFTLRAGDDRLVAEGENVLVGYDYEEGKSAPLAEALLEGLRCRIADPA